MINKKFNKLFLYIIYNYENTIMKIMKNIKLFEDFDKSYIEEEEPIINPFQISVITDDDYPDDIPGFTVVDEKIISTDNEKGFSDIEIILKQDIPNGNYFKVTYTQYGYNGSDFLEQTAYRVERKTKTIYYYE